MDCVVTPLKTLMGFSVHLNVQLKITFYFLKWQLLRLLYAFSLIPLAIWQWALTPFILLSAVVPQCWHRNFCFRTIAIRSFPPASRQWIKTGRKVPFLTIITLQFEHLGDGTSAWTRWTSWLSWRYSISRPLNLGSKIKYGSTKPVKDLIRLFMRRRSFRRKRSRGPTVFSFFV